MAVTSLSSPATVPAHILITGATGFLGQALLERLLTDHPYTRITLLIRAGRHDSARDRLRALLQRPVFGAVGNSARRHVLADSIGVVEADLTGAYSLPADLDAVVHCASSVKFDEGLDTAFDTNVAGTQRLYAALAEGNPTTHVIHVSTAYVNSGRVPVSFDEPVRHDTDWRTELARVRALSATLRHPDHQGHAEAKLSLLGAQRASELGWTDVYTLTKALGERVAEELWAAGRLTVLRPSIIESALTRPYPGWIDGFKVADPVIAAYARGQLRHFPGHPDTVLDLIPVDLVVNATLASLLNPPHPGAPRYLQVASGTSNPLTLGDLLSHARSYFGSHPWIDATGRACYPADFRYRSPKQLQTRVAYAQRALAAAARVLDLSPASQRTALRRRVATSHTRLELLSEYMALYTPYTCGQTVFDTSEAAQLSRNCHPLLRFEASSLDWSHYLPQVHLPAVVDLMKAHRRPLRVAQPGAVATSAHGARASRQARRAQQRLQVSEELR